MRLACLAALLCAVVLPSWGADRLPDLVINGDFEAGLRGFAGHQGAAVVTQDPRSGERCVRIDGVMDKNSFVQQSVAVEPGREYDFVVWSRCEDVPADADCKAYYNVFAGEEVLASIAPLPRINETRPWTRQAARVRMPEGADRALLTLQLHESTGTVWFDDLSFVPVATEEEEARWESQATAQAEMIAGAQRMARTAPEIAPGVQAQETEDGLFLCNSSLALMFAGPSGAFGLRGLVDLEAERSFIVPGFGDAIFRVELRPKQPYHYAAPVVYSSFTPASGCSSELARDGEDALLTLRWEAVPAGEIPAIDAEATIRLGATGASRWQLTVKSHLKGCGIWLVDFPRIPGLGASGDNAPLTDYLAISNGQGWRWPDPRRTIDYGEGWADYPGGGKSMQFEAYCVGDATQGGLYLATEDPRGFRKSVLYEARGDVFSYALRNYPPDMGRTDTYEMSYPAAIGVFPGDWWDAAQIYRTWALKQPWSAAGPMQERKTTPEWFKQIAAWAQGDLPGQEFAEMAIQAERAIRFAQTVGAPTMFHAYMWQASDAHDKGYPFMLPPKPGAAAFFTLLRSAGVRTAPYLNIYSADAGDPRFETEDLKPLAMRTAEGGMAGNPEHLVAMCPASKRWQELLARQFEGTLDALPTDGLYLDQLTGHPYLCFDPDHGHPLGGGDHFSQGVRQICRAARKALVEKCPEGILFGENTSEAYNDLVDAHLTWAEMHCDRLLPLYQAVYADYIIRCGLFMGRPDMSRGSAGYYSKLAWGFTTGEQLGWVMFGILKDFDAPKYAPQRKYLHDLAACRSAALDFLAFGQYLRPLDFGQVPVPVRWDDWSTPREGAFPPVLNSVWRAADGRIGVVLANWTASEQAVLVPISEEWQLRESVQWRACVDGTWGQLAPAEGAGVPVTLPAHSATIIELRAPLLADPGDTDPAPTAAQPASVVSP